MLRTPTVLASREGIREFETYKSFTAVLSTTACMSFLGSTSCRVRLQWDLSVVRSCCPRLLRVSCEVWPLVAKRLEEHLLTVAPAMKPLGIGAVAEHVLGHSHGNPHVQRRLYPQPTDRKMAHHAMSFRGWVRAVSRV